MTPTEQDILDTIRYWQNRGINVAHVAPLLRDLRGNASWGRVEARMLRWMKARDETVDDTTNIAA